MKLTEVKGKRLKAKYKLPDGLELKNLYGVYFAGGGKGYRIKKVGSDQYELKIDSKERRKGHIKGQPLIKKCRKTYFTHP